MRFRHSAYPADLSRISSIARTVGVDCRLRYGAYCRFHLTTTRGQRHQVDACFSITRFAICFLPNTLFLICSNWNANASSVALLSRSFRSSSAIRSFWLLFSASSRAILSLALAYKTLRLRSRMSLCFTSSAVSFTLTVYHRVWRRVWILTQTLDIVDTLNLCPRRIPKKKTAEQAEDSSPDPV